MSFYTFSLLTLIGITYFKIPFFSFLLFFFLEIFQIETYGKSIVRLKHVSTNQYILMNHLGHIDLTSVCLYHAFFSIIRTSLDTSGADSGESGGKMGAIKIACSIFNC